MTGKKDEAGAWPSRNVLITVLFKGQNESFWYISICSCSNIVNYAPDNFAEFQK